MSRMARWIALLRGINVGGHAKVPMARLRELFDELGHEDVKTYVQSGNVVFTGPDRPHAEVADEIEDALEAAFGFRPRVLVRTRDEIAAVVDANPLGDVADNPSRYFVNFLDEEIAPERLAEPSKGDYAPEAFHLRGRELYIWAPGGVRDSPVL
ncbi:MAG: hypothetical protein QOJ12_333, partial [Thermoleophilales bacterium]|nr:hypothetical protein [Thermoleophilales bacterium]